MSTFVVQPSIENLCSTSIFLMNISVIFPKNFYWIQLWVDSFDQVAVETNLRFPTHSGPWVIKSKRNHFFMFRHWYFLSMLIRIPKKKHPDMDIKSSQKNDFFWRSSFEGPKREMYTYPISSHVKLTKDAPEST